MSDDEIRSAVAMVTIRQKAGRTNLLFVNTVRAPGESWIVLVKQACRYGVDNVAEMFLSVSVNSCREPEMIGRVAR